MNRNRFKVAIEQLEARVLFSAGGAADLVHTTAHLSIPKWQPATISTGSSAFFAGGYTRQPNTDVVDIYHSQTNSWTVEKLSTARAGNVAARAGAKLIFATGISPASNTMDIFDTKTSKWSVVNFRRAIQWSLAVSTSNAAVFVGVNGDTEVYDARTQIWYHSKLSNIEITVGTAVGEQALFESNAGPAPLIYRYNENTRKWTKIAFPPHLGGPASATTIGTRAIFVGAGSTPNGLVSTAYDSVTGLWSVTPLPANTAVSSATSIGSKALFAGDANDIVSVYDATTNGWSTTNLGQANFRPVGTSVGNHALFAGGSISDTQAIVPTDAVDIFTDTNPTAVLSGRLTGGIGHRDMVTVVNTGDADLAGPYSINLYASTDRTLTGALLVGSRVVGVPLAIGASATFGIRTIPPKDLPAGTYHLLAAVRDAAGNITPIAAEDSTFRIGASKSALPSASRKTLHAGGGAFTELSKIGRSP